MVSAGQATSVSDGAYLSLGAVVFAAALAVPAAAEVMTVTPPALPFPLVSGWEAADEDPPDGVAGLDRLTWRPADPLREPGPPEAIRWYRQRLDLSACRGLALAFYATSIRDADETYFDGQRIGATGTFPPAMGLATIHFPPHVDVLAMTQRRSWIDQVLAALAAVSLSLAAAFVL